MGPRLGTSDPQEGCQLPGPFSPPAEESYLSTISESHVEAKKSPTNLLPVQGACCIVCIKLASQT